MDLQEYRTEASQAEDWDQSDYPLWMNRFELYSESMPYRRARLHNQMSNLFEYCCP